MTTTETTTDRPVQRQLSSGDWMLLTAAEAAFYVERVLPSERARFATGHRACYRLRDGDFGLISPAPSWYDQIRLAPAPRVQQESASVSRHSPFTTTFTCPRCGGHRDTTVTGHCDDCEA